MLHRKLKWFVGSLYDDGAQLLALLQAQVLSTMYIPTFLASFLRPIVATLFS